MAYRISRDGRMFHYGGMNGMGAAMVSIAPSRPTPAPIVRQVCPCPKPTIWTPCEGLDRIVTGELPLTRANLRLSGLGESVPVADGTDAGEAAWRVRQDTSPGAIRPVTRVGRAAIGNRAASLSIQDPVGLGLTHDYRRPATGWAPHLGQDMPDLFPDPSAFPSRGGVSAGHAGALAVSGGLDMGTVISFGLLAWSLLKRSGRRR